MLIIRWAKCWLGGSWRDSSWIYILLWRLNSMISQVKYWILLLIVLLDCFPGVYDHLVFVEFCSLLNVFGDSDLSFQFTFISVTVLGNTLSCFFCLHWLCDSLVGSLLDLYVALHWLGHLLSLIANWRVYLPFAYLIHWQFLMITLGANVVSLLLHFENQVNRILRQVL